MSKVRPHICFLAPNAYPLLSGDRSTQLIGGAELQQVIVARGLAARGYTVSMICLDFGQEDKVEIDGVVVYKAFRQNAGLPVVRFFWPRLTTIWRCLKRVDADVYYFRTAAMLAGAMAAFCRRHGKRSIFAAAGNPDLEKNTSKIRYARDRRIFEYGVRNVDRIFVQNEQQADLCRQVYGRDSVRIPNVYAPERSTAAGDSRVVLWVSTIRRIKQPQIFLDVAEASAQHEFQFVGGPDNNEMQLYDDVKARSDRMANVDFAGFVPYAEVGQYFDRAAVFVNTSESEGFPNTFLQSWSRAIPTVSFVDSGARWKGEPLGRIVSSTEEMIEAVRTLMGDEQQRRDSGRACRSYVESVHSPDRVLDRYEQAIGELMATDASTSGRS